MYKRKAKPDLMFLLAVFVCLGVLVTATVNAREENKQGWAVMISSETGCQETIGVWQNCINWQGTVKTNPADIQRTSVSFIHNTHPDLGLVWYYSQYKQNNDNYINGIQSFDAQFYNNVDRQAAGQFGVVLRQQYRHFGFSVGVESEQALLLNNEATLFLGVSNRW